MKTAILISGHMRCWEIVYPNFQHHFAKYDPDIYIATWETEGYWTSPENDPNNKGINTNSPLINVEKIMDTYKPVRMQVSRQDDYEPIADKIVELYQLEKHSVQIRPRNIISQFHLMQQVAGLVRDSGIHYEFVIRIRPDLIFLNEIPSLTSENVYYLPHTNHEGKGIGDMFLAGPSDIIIKYMDEIQAFSCDVASSTGRFCPHISSELYLKNYLQIGRLMAIMTPKTLQHTPNGMYKDFVND
jgi:hypothetical protein